MQTQFKCDYATAEIEQEEGGESESNNPVHKQVMSQGNIFNNLPSLAPLKSTPLVDQITLYLTVPPKNVKDAIKWWRENHNVYP